MLPEDKLNFERKLYFQFSGHHLELRYRQARLFCNTSFISLSTERQDLAASLHLRNFWNYGTFSDLGKLTHVVVHGLNVALTSSYYHSPHISRAIGEQVHAASWQSVQMSHTDNAIDKAACVRINSVNSPTSPPSDVLTAAHQRLSRVYISQPVAG
jgi:hypothetical protein